MGVITAISNKFDLLASKFLRTKQDEKEAVDLRRQVGAEILELPEVEAHKRDKGSITLRSDTYEIGVTYTQSETRDMEALSKALPVEALARIFPAKPTFSQTGLNAYLKELDGLSLTDPAAKRLAKKIRDALESHTTSKPGAPQISVSKLD